MIKNQKGNVLVTAVVIIAVLVIMGVGFWLILSSKQRSSKILNDRGAVEQRDSESNQ